MWDFLTFQTFVSPDILILFYYIGAVIFPIVMWKARGYLVQKVPLFQTAQNRSKILFNALNTQDKIVVVITFITMFIGMELVWRMMFETVIAYFNMHEYLQILSSSPK